MQDHTQDTSRGHLFKIGSLIHMPDFVKEAELVSPEDLKTLPSESFADPDKRQFPVPTPADTWLSTTYFTKQAAEYPRGLRNEISQRLLTAIDFWQIGDSFTYSPEQLVKEAAAPVMTITYTHKDMEEARAQVCTFEDFEKVASDLLAHKEKYPWDTRRDVAKQLLQAPKEFLSKVADEQIVALQRTAGMQKAALSTVKQVVKDRMSYLHKAGHIEAVQTLKNGFEELEKTASGDIVDEAFLDKTAALVDDLTRFVGLCSANHCYTRQMPACEDVFGGVVNKQAQAMKSQYILLPNGTLVKTSEIQKQAKAIGEFCKDALALDLTTSDDLKKITAEHASILVRAFPKLVA